ncbi:helix-turn-helix domain-containing protein [Actinotalea ferrariae]|uniref:helix-turn-helix transcriptional regulator n=1 Tax=Actinotalea ferrariae TaxID=1386098 RepID=UPI001C8C1F6B|nr:helix-turn-helix transcriptional regulator [Actinotalea ferrariae]MBX9245276.1 helix-turn-helix domain-containing protein [Actinotalea ferrariae]
MDREALADFLRRRRAALRPADVGLAEGARRRTAGLRREEVAALAGMSADYYTRLEQQRGPRPSEQMLAAIARALRLTADERDHVFVLAGHVAPPRSRRTLDVSPALLRVLDRLHDTPALIITDVGETLAQSRPAVALFGERTQLPWPARSSYYRWFTDPVERELYPQRDHAHQSAIQAGALRAALADGGPRGAAADLVRRLRGESAEFVEVWERHEVVRSRFDDHKTLVHRELGAIEVDCQVMYSENRAQALLVLTATPGTESDEKLRLLAVIGDQRLSTP